MQGVSISRLARSVPDLAAMLRVMAGAHPSGPSSVVKPQLQGRNVKSPLKNLGGLRIPVTQDPAPPWWTIAAAESFASEAWLLDLADLIAPDSLRTTRMGEAISAREYLDAQHARSELIRTWALFLERFDFIVSPGEQVLPFPGDQSEPSRNREVAEGDWWGMDSVANLTGQRFN